jgi:type 1 fimbria pilin
MKNLSACFIFTFLIMLSANCMAGISCYTAGGGITNMNYKTLTISNPSITWTGPANNLVVGTTPATWTNSGRDDSFFSCFDTSRFVMRASSGIIQTWFVSKINPLNGVTVTKNGVIYPVFPTGVAGIGYILGVADPNKTLSPLGSTAQQLFSTKSDAITLGVKYEFNYVITGPLTSGTTNIPSQTIGEVQLRDDQTIAGTSPVQLSAATLTVTASTCTVNNSSNITVALPWATTFALTKTGNTSIPTSFNIQLTCPSGINTYMVFTDKSNMGNTSSQLSLAADSTAKGVAVQIIKADGSLVSFGPDSANPNTTNQFLVSTNVSGSQLIPFQARLVRTADPIAAGSVIAAATFTFSYQ